MNDFETFLSITLLIILAYIIIKFLKNIFTYQKKRKVFLSVRMRAKTDRKYSKLLNRFRKQHGRKPTRNEAFRLAINASHITIRRRGKRGHWGRQKVRKHLLEKNGVVDKYRMR
jgi:hypothetical protein